MNLTGQPIHSKDPTARTKRNCGSDPKRLAEVAAMPCCICAKHDMRQLSHTQVHHCIMGRGGSRKSPDSMTIPLCEGHHQGLRDTSKIAIHQSAKSWRDRYGADTDWLVWVENLLNKRTVDGRTVLRNEQ